LKLKKPEEPDLDMNFKGSMILKVFCKTLLLFKITSLNKISHHKIIIRETSRRYSMT